MSITASEFLESARVMLKSDAEVNCRNCISRAYYATFHTAVPFARQFGDAGFDDEDPVGCHERVIRRFTQKGNPPAIQNMGGMLRSLKRMRARADYRLRARFTQSDAVRAVNEAQHFCALVERASGVEVGTGKKPKKRRRKTKSAKR